MSRFNAKLAVQPKNVPAPAAPKSTVKPPKVSRAKPTTTNAAGGAAYDLKIREAVANVVLNSMLQDQFYTSAQNRLAELQTLIARAASQGAVDFVMKCAVYARQVYGLRTVSHVLAAEVAEHARGSILARPFFNAVILRPDDICEIMAYWKSRHPGVRYPNAMTRGFADALARFSPYAISKYRGDGKDVKLVDAINVCHPKVPKDHGVAKLIKGTLESPDTWEVALSTGADKGETFARLLREKQLGYLATLRNLRNIAQTGNADAIYSACALISNKDAVAKSLVFPFQFVTAIKALAEGNIPGNIATRVCEAVAEAVDHSLSNVPVFDGRTLVVLDDSGSMRSTASSVKDRSCADVASMFVAALLKANPTADYLQFNSEARWVQIPRKDSLLTVAQHVLAACRQGGTNFASIFSVAKPEYDRVIILSDMQGWMESGLQATFANWCRRGKTPFLYTFDLSGGTTSMFPQAQVALMSGFSNRVFDVMTAVEQGGSLIDTIEKVALAPQSNKASNTNDDNEG